MKLTLLGTGCPSVDSRRFGPACLVSNRDTKILIDCGSGVTQRLVQSGFKGAEIDCLLITHLHSDHVIDFYQLIISSWHQYRKKKWKIIGPKGSKKLFSSLMNAWFDERELRIKYERRESIEGFELDITEIENDGKIVIDDIYIEYFKVDHSPVQYAFGYNFLLNKSKITISGDTKPCKNLIKHALNADILLHEVFVENEIKPFGKMRTSETIENVKSYHTSSYEVGKIAKEVKAKNLVLYHFVPPIFDEKELIKRVSKDFGKSPILGKDLMTLDIDGNIY